METYILVLSTFTILLVPLYCYWGGENPVPYCLGSAVVCMGVLFLIVMQQPDPMKVFREEVFCAKYLWEIPLSVIGSWILLRFWV